MGMVLCELHGRQGLAMCCDHVERAVHGELSRVELVIGFAPDRFPRYACPACSGDAVGEAVCLGCLARWFAEAGNGDLHAAVQRARRDAGVSPPT